MNTESCIDFTDKYEENAKQELASGALSFETFVLLQWCWSKKTFGPAHLRGPFGPLEHLKKEIEEVKFSLAVLESLTDQKDRDLRVADIHEEFADLFFLVFDAAWRAGMSAMDIRKALTAKLTKNRNRSWPAFKPENADKPVEHDRTHDIGGES